jgi:hypothetical protein
MALKPFSKTQDEAKIRAASEVEPIYLPFQHKDYLSSEYSNGVTEYCFFLRSKATGEVYPWNQHMAESGNVHLLPEFNLDYLNNPEFEGITALWARQGILPKGYGPKAEAPKATKFVPAPKPAVAKTAAVA